MLILALANFIANYSIDSTPYPLTRLMLEELSGGINSMLAIVLIFYSGELIFRERQVNFADVSDVMPVPNWVPLLAKAGDLVAVSFAYLVTTRCCASPSNCSRAAHRSRRCCTCRAG